MFTFSVAINTQQGRELIAPFSMSVNQNDKIAIIGEEGSGKSLLLKTLSRSSLTDLVVDFQISHDVSFYRLQQDIAVEEESLTLLEYVINNNWEQYGLFAQHQPIILPELEDEDFDRKLHSFSGGERVKIQILKMILSEADVYLLDEPTNNLDLESLLWLESWVDSCEQPVIFVSHDLEFIRNLANKVVHFEHIHRKSRSQVTVWNGTYDEYMNHRENSANNTNQKIDTQKREQDIKDQKWQRQYQQVSHQLQHVARQDPGLQKKMKALKATRKRYDREEVNSKVEEERSIQLSFEDFSGVLRHYNLEVPRNEIDGKHLGSNYLLHIRPGEKIALTGNNGVGKTTLLKQFKTQLEKTANVGYMGQAYLDQLNLDLTPLETCQINSEVEHIKKVTNHLTSLNLTYDEIHTPLKYLSGGQRTKVLLLKLVLNQSDILVLDEPSRNLSYRSRLEMMSLLKEYRGSILCITHDRALIEEVMETSYQVSENGLLEI